jgi:iron complex transport system substrate-binding protein
MPILKRAAILLVGFAAALRAGPAPIRVVSQTVGTDELLLAVAAPGQVAALSHLARDPEFSAVAEEAKAYPQLQLNGDAESVIKFGPALVLCADYSRPELVAQLRRAGVQVMIFDHYSTIEDAYANLRMLARSLGTGGRAESVVADCRARVLALKKRLEGVTPVGVIAPSTYSLLPGAGTTFQDLCDHSGAENLAATLGHLVGNAPQPSEQMLVWPVDFVVVAGTTPAKGLAPYLDTPPYEYMAAVRDRHVVLVPAWVLGCVSHRRVLGYEILARTLHPEAFR